MVPSTHQKERRGYLKGCVCGTVARNFLVGEMEYEGKAISDAYDVQTVLYAQLASLLLDYLHPKARNGFFFSPATRHRIYLEELIGETKAMV